MASLSRVRAWLARAPFLASGEWLLRQRFLVASTVIGLEFALLFWLIAAATGDVIRSAFDVALLLVVALAGFGPFAVWWVRRHQSPGE